MYKVVKFFTDLQDNGHPYNVGDVYPRDGKTVTQARLDELASDNNRQKKPLIQKVNDEPTVVEPVIEPEVIEPEVVEPVEPVEPKKKRSRSK